MLGSHPSCLVTKLNVIHCMVTRMFDKVPGDIFTALGKLLFAYVWITWKHGRQTANNLTLSGSKSVEIVFTTKRQQQFTPPSLHPGITRVIRANDVLYVSTNRQFIWYDNTKNFQCVTTLKVLRVIISYKLSVSAHVQNIVSSYAQSVHAIKSPSYPWHVRGGDTDSFPECCRRQTDVRSQRLVGLHYGNWSAAWLWRQSSAGVTGVRSVLCHSDILTAAELIEDMDDDLFQRILWNENHTLHALLPDRRPNLTYELRPRSHDREMSNYKAKLSCLTENNFLIDNSTKTATNILSLFHFIRPIEFS